MVQTRNNSEGSNQPPDPVATQLAAIAKKLESIDALQKEVAALKSQSHNRDRSGYGNGRQDEGESSWHNQSLKQTGTVQEYRQEFAKRSSRVSNWPEHCLLGVFLNGLKEEQKADVRIQKPRTVYKAVSIALEFESKISHARSGRGPTWTAPSKSTQPESKVSPYTSTSSNSNSKPPLRISDGDRQSRYLRGECYRCGDKYGPGHRCKTGSLKLLEVEEELDEQPSNEVDHVAGDTNDVAEISLYAIFGKPHPRTMKVQVSDLYIDLGDCAYACEYCNATFWYGERLKGCSHRHRRLIQILDDHKELTELWLKGNSLNGTIPEGRWDI
ncbi:retrotransposon gag domain, Retroviral aspartyl protease [Artemisia annua]|uniref:Retrotransposon gag domain, Retroviral aspartyl protease n=1 Tax=Artemisia annua TaxID=35608 RepID=A0A2U1Q0E1_ARTAN|nr:retrotransposon gag domain, Retroviral aspartyl protease [Artemisia annua]